MRGKPAGSPVTLRGFRWYGPGEPEEGDIALTEAGHAAYLVEKVTPSSAPVPPDGFLDAAGYHWRYTLECIKLDPADIGIPDWILTWAPRR